MAGIPKKRNALNRNGSGSPRGRAIRMAGKPGTSKTAISRITVIQVLRIRTAKATGKSRDFSPATTALPSIATMRISIAAASALRGWSKRAADACRGATPRDG